MRQTRNSLQHSSAVAAFCNNLRHSATSGRPESSKDVVVEHKGLSDGLVFFHSQRVRGQQFPRWDKSASVSDDCPTPGIPPKN